MERLFQTSNQLLAQVQTDFQRYIYQQINWKNRLIGLIGARGIGKTTLVLQHIKANLDPQKTLYVTTEDFYFAQHRLTHLADEFVKAGGQHLVIDEIHKYPDWSRELKLIYDYHPNLQVVFTGSSVLDIKKGSADLSRRAIVYSMQGLSFREYLHLFHKIEIPVYSLDDLLNQRVAIPSKFRPLPYFADYLRIGYYPFSREMNFDIRLQQVIDQTLEIDIPSYADMNVSTGRKLKQLMSIVSESVPFKPNMSKIAAMLNISRNNIADYLLYMEEAGMISQLRSKTEGVRALGKVDKIYLDNTNLMQQLGNKNQNVGNVRETFFLNQTRVQHQVNTSAMADFSINDSDFEVGGKNKGLKQIQNAPKGFVVKDDIEQGYLNVIPLWHFGLLY
jgi:predicted AAA+ superfamily ATPase